MPIYATNSSEWCLCGRTAYDNGNAPHLCYECAQPISECTCDDLPTLPNIIQCFNCERQSLDGYCTGCGITSSRCRCNDIIITCTDCQGQYFGRDEHECVWEGYDEQGYYTSLVGEEARVRIQEQRERRRRLIAQEERTNRRQTSIYHSLNAIPSPPDEEQRVISRDCTCEACKIRRFEDSKIADAVVHTYSDTPEFGWEPLGWGDYYLGVELETDNYFRSNGYQIDSSIRYETAAAMALPEDFWFPKRDSSVSGPEFASQPATMSYWNSLKDNLELMFRTLLHAGYRSHDNNTCGMHVNISESAFNSSDELYRFLTLIYHSPKWSLRMSQRTQSSMNQWAKLTTGIKDTQERKKVCDRFEQELDIGVDKYTALNFPQDGRLEFRLPRGTLRLDRFYKNLEWTEAMIQYAKRFKLSDCRPTKFMSWVEDNKKLYPNLVAFINERIKKEAYDVPNHP